MVVALGLVLMPPVLLGIGLTLTSATDVVAIACMGLNLLVGYTGLVSFGHGAWFGLGVAAASSSATSCRANSSCRVRSRCFSWPSWR